MQKNKTRALAYGGLLTALIAALTAYVHIALPAGYLNPGDSANALAGAVLGYYAAIPAALGSGIADLLAGYPIYAPFTFVIKGFVGLTAGIAISKRRGYLRAFMWLLAGAAAIIGGYFLVDYALYRAGAFASIWGNALQGALFIVSGLFFKKLDIARYLNRG